MRKVRIFGAMLVVGVAGVGQPVAAATPQDAFFANLSALCGKKFPGKLISNEERDAEMRGQPMVAHIRDCSKDEIRIPFSLGDDNSRTWVVTRTADGLRLKHDHRHEDGTEDAMSQYGGDTKTPGTATRQEFPVDQFSIDLFTRLNAHVSTTNVWSYTLLPGESLTYALTREGRDFRVAFDLSRPLD